MSSFASGRSLWLSESHISSSATQILFVHRNGKNYCVKRWLPCQNTLYATTDNVVCTQYTIDGLHFNRRFAPNVYLGIAPIEVRGNIVYLGPLLKTPLLDEVQKDLEYGLVMKRLKENWRLDYQLHPALYGNSQGMLFLAHSIAKMHSSIIQDARMQAPEEMGNAKMVNEKWLLNRELFEECQELLPGRLKRNMAMYRNIEQVMDKACSYYTDYFEQRYQEQHIKRCHGDLKASNLWIRYSSSSQSKTSSYDSRQLLALDCVDFKPAFSYIDTLSDVAMLMIDLELQMTLYTRKWSGMKSAQELSQKFLDAYLVKMYEKNSALTQPLLEYYMTEKAIICAYMNIIYDKKIALGIHYLNVASIHAEKLSQLMH